MGYARQSATLALLVVFCQANAHHSIAREYDGARRTRVSGVVSEFRFLNPHPFLFVEVVTETGMTETWRLEMDNRFELVRVGMTAETFAAGDRVEAEGSLGRTASRTLYIRLLERPADGLRYEQVGFSPELVITGR